MRFIFDIVVVVVIGSLAVFLYFEYWDDVRKSFTREDSLQTIYLGSNAISVTVADDAKERVRGLSGTPSLQEREGKLFIFDTNAPHGIWMKDMLIPLDIIWVDDTLTVVYIQEQVSPETYPKVFMPDRNARFVIETNAHLVESLKIAIGDRLTLPPPLLPADIKKNLQQ